MIKNCISSILGGLISIPKYHSYMHYNLVDGDGGASTCNYLTFKYEHSHSIL